MPLINRIASRIFGLAVGLVLLMILLVGFLLWQVTALNNQLQRISGYFAPLDHVLNELNEAGLKRRIAFEGSPVVCQPRRIAPLQCLRLRTITRPIRGWRRSTSSKRVNLGPSANPCRPASRRATLVGYHVDGELWAITAHLESHPAVTET